MLWTNPHQCWSASVNVHGLRYRVIEIFVQTDSKDTHRLCCILAFALKHWGKREDSIAYLLSLKSSFVLNVSFNFYKSEVCKSTIFCSAYTPTGAVLIRRLLQCLYADRYSPYTPTDSPYTPTDSPNTPTDSPYTPTNTVLIRRLIQS